jgi:ATP phosphoribosyltransferase regulatory subunit
MLIDNYLGDHDIAMIGTRTLAEIAENLVAAAKDAKAEPLSLDDAQTIQSYVGISAQARAVTARLRDLERQRGIDISEAVDRFQRRLDLLTGAGVDIGKSMFSAEFGRSLEYYTGFVFEIEAPFIGEGIPVVGGGRYDGLLREVGAPFDVPAVGAAIHTERLLDAIAMDASAAEDEA